MSNDISSEALRAEFEAWVETNEFLPSPWSAFQAGRRSAPQREACAVPDGWTPKTTDLYAAICIYERDVNRVIKSQGMKAAFDYLLSKALAALAAAPAPAAFATETPTP